jgi:hypothetical protein
MEHHLLANIPVSTLEELKVASNLGNSVFVETLTTSLGSVQIVSAGSLLFDKESFITSWIWLCIGGKYYAPLVTQENSPTEYVSRMASLNPEVWNYTNHAEGKYQQENFTGLIFAILNKRFKDMSNDERLLTFTRVIDELD